MREDSGTVVVQLRWRDQEVVDVLSVDDPIPGVSPSYNSYQ